MKNSYELFFVRRRRRCLRRQATRDWGSHRIAPVEGVLEKEVELPAVTDCTTLALVDDAQGESALLEKENQDFGIEPKDHLKGIYSTTPVAQNFLQVQRCLATSRFTSTLIKRQGL